MNKFSTNAITLKSYDLSESDKIVVLYSQDHGIMRCVAKGAKKPTKKASSIDNLLAKKFLLSKGKNLDLICQSEGINHFSGIRQDIFKLSYSLYCSELINIFGVEDDPASLELYQLLYKTFENISSAKNSCNTILCVLKFQINLMELLGYAVELDECLKCSKPLDEEEIYFSPQSGGILCADCVQGVNDKRLISGRIRLFLKKVAASDFASSYFHDKELKNESTIIFCYDLIREYISVKSPKKINSSVMIESLNSFVTK